MNYDSFRSHVTNGDVATVHQLVTGTGFFSEQEADIAAELVQETLDQGAASGYHFAFLETSCDAAVSLMLGYACFGAIPCTVGSFDVYWIVVRHDMQRRGIGGRLLREVERVIRIQQGRHIYIETSGRPQYQPTRSFYESHGYEQVALLPDFYAPGDPKVVYRAVVNCQ